MKLNHWDSGREEMRNIPVVCAACEQQVSVGGQIQDGVMVFDPCPNCGAVITGGLYVDDGEDEKEDRELEIGAEVEWFIDGGVEFQRSNSFGPLKKVPSLLVAVLMAGVDYFSQPDLAKDYVYTSIACMITKNLLSIQGVGSLMEVCEERLAKPVVAGGPQLVKLNGDNGKSAKSESQTEENTDDDE